jgi:GNAT superfamily N-acetyltransferase
VTEAVPTLRRAGPDDAAALADVYLRARRAATQIPPMAHPDEEVRGWIAEAVIPRLQTWLAESPSGRPVALMVLDDDELDQLYVDPACQGEGLGAALVALAQARRTELALWTFESNAGARRFYERHGFTPEGEPSTDNEEATAAVRYRWRRRDHPNT